MRPSEAGACSHFSVIPVASAGMTDLAARGLTARARWRTLGLLERTGRGHVGQPPPAALADDRKRVLGIVLNRQERSRQASGMHTDTGHPYDGRVFSAWMLGCSLVVGNAAILLLFFAVIVPAAWLGIVVSLCIYRTRRRILIGIAGGALMVWPFLLMSL